MTRNRYGYPQFPPRFSMWDALVIFAGVSLIGWALWAGKAEVTRILMGVQR